MNTRRTLTAALLGLALPALVQAGTITGTVSAKGVPGASEGGASGGSYGSRRYKFVERIDYSQLCDFVVYIDQAAPVGEGEQVQAAMTVQRDASFDPHVLPIAVGTTVRWPNEDEIFHNVFSMSDAKEFNLGLYNKEKVPAVTFDKVGRVDVFCAIHTKMHCIILVLPNPYFARADAKGRFTISNVPPGTYKLRAWHERLPSQVKEVVVPAEGEVKIDFELGLSELPKY